MVDRLEEPVDPVLGAHDADVADQVLAPAAARAHLAAAHGRGSGVLITTVVRSTGTPPRLVATSW